MFQQKDGECYPSSRKISYRGGSKMASIEKISIALPPEMVLLVRQAVETGEYASNSEVVRDALRDWIHKRSLRQQGIEELRRVWQQALEDRSPGVAPDEVLDRLERKYQAITDAAGTQRECA
jgi:antitoxin ParD1/3/4